jgi:hypothetical protein
MRHFAVMGGSFLFVDISRELRGALQALATPERVKRRLLAGPADGEPLPRGLLAAAPPPALVDTLPVVLTGPAGCGKSTAASELARSLRDGGVPVLYMRLGDGHAAAAGSAAGASGSPATPNVRMAALVECACAALIGGSATWRWGWYSSWNCEEQLNAAFTAAFDGCRRLAPAPGGGGRGAHVPVIIVDGLFSLVSDEGLVGNGGREAFAHFTRLVERHCLAGGAVRVVVAADTPLPVALDSYNTALLTPLLPTWLSARVVTVADATPAEARRRLRERGYADGDVDAIVGTCGTRAALLAPFLAARKAPAAAKAASVRAGAAVPAGGDGVDVAARLAAVRRVAAWRVSQLFDGSYTYGGDAKLASLLDAAAAAGITTGAAGAPEAAGPLPSYLYEKAIKQVLYADAGGVLRMQSEPVRAAWRELRPQYVR